MILYFWLLIPLSTSALTFEVVGACSAKPVYAGTYDSASKNVGQASLEIFTRENITFQGTAEGFSSILNTPTGDSSLEVISDEELRAYGWCFEVDGIQPALMPNEVSLTGSEHIRWFYGFALNRRNEWVSYCEPAHAVKPAAICGEQK